MIKLLLERLIGKPVRGENALIQQPVIRTTIATEDWVEIREFNKDNIEHYNKWTNTLKFGSMY